ncbi:trace amine-associated receptor 1-like isoform X2 [Stylophora pistillata]|uniref:trace amine-associated receptor 1-like isoform X2 n=1 Tax=Stylophora pistillata TaxID=50429 RepID=UPI000C03ECD5|nr:trace amine-associated receptor 1-like isoform X2 [Stylophora pistillata]
MNKTFKISSCRDSQRISNILMIAVVLIGSIVGNGIICLLLIRFKTLRSVPNLLIANLAVVNILDALTNMPLFILWYICKVPPLKGRSISWTVISWYVLFLYLMVFNLTLLAMDRYGAIVHGFRYHVWKTKNKAKVAVLVVWVLAALYTYGLFTLGLDIDLGDAPVLLYRMTYLKTFGRHFIIPGILIPFMIMLILGLAVCVTVRNHRKRFSTFFAVKIRIENDVKTAKTIGLTVLAYFCMNVIPMLLHNILRRHGSWPHFLAFFLMKLNSMVNPIIYALKAPRLRRALALLLKEPRGKSEPNMNSKILNNLSSTAIQSYYHQS